MYIALGTAVGSPRPDPAINAFLVYVSVDCGSTDMRVGIPFFMEGATASTESVNQSMSCRTKVAAYSHINKTSESK